MPLEPLPLAGRRSTLFADRAARMRRQFVARRRHRRDRRGGLPVPRRPASGHRARRRPGQVAVGRRDRAAAGRPLHPAAATRPAGGPNDAARWPRRSPGATTCCSPTTSEASGRCPASPAGRPGRGRARPDRARAFPHASAVDVDRPARRPVAGQRRRPPTDGDRPATGCSTASARSPSSRLERGRAGPDDARGRARRLVRRGRRVVRRHRAQPGPAGVPGPRPRASGPTSTPRWPGAADHDPRLGVRMANGFGWTWVVLGRRRRRRRPCARRLSRPAPGHRPSDRATGLLLAGWLEASAGNVEPGPGRPRRAPGRSPSGSADDAPARPTSRRHLAFVRIQQGRPDDVLEAPRPAWTRTGRLELRVGDRGQPAARRLRVDHAGRHRQRHARRPPRRCGSGPRSGDAGAWCTPRRCSAPWPRRAPLRRRRRRADPRRRALRETMGFAGQAALHLTTLGRVQQRSGSPDQALDTLARAIRSATTGGDLRVAATARIHLARTLRATGDQGSARTLLEEKTAGTEPRRRRRRLLTRGGWRSGGRGRRRGPQHRARRGAPPGRPRDPDPRPRRPRASRGRQRRHPAGGPAPPGGRRPARPCPARPRRRRPRRRQGRPRRPARGG